MSSLYPSSSTPSLGIKRKGNEKKAVQSGILHSIPWRFLTEDAVEPSSSASVELTPAAHSYWKQHVEKKIEEEDNKLKQQHDDEHPSDSPPDDSNARASLEPSPLSLALEQRTAKYMRLVALPHSRSSPALQTHLPASLQQPHIQPKLTPSMQQRHYMKSLRNTVEFQQWQISHQHMIQQDVDKWMNEGGEKQFFQDYYPKPAPINPFTFHKQKQPHTTNQVTNPVEKKRLKLKKKKQERWKKEILDMEQKHKDEIAAEAALLPAFLPPTSPLPPSYRHAPPSSQNVPEHILHTIHELEKEIVRITHDHIRAEQVAPLPCRVPGRDKQEEKEHEALVIPSRPPSSPSPSIMPNAPASLKASSYSPLPTGMSVRPPSSHGFTSPLQNNRPPSSPGFTPIQFTPYSSSFLATGRPPSSSSSTNRPPSSSSPFQSPPSITSSSPIPQPVNSFTPSSTQSLPPLTASPPLTTGPDILASYQECLAPYLPEASVTDDPSIQFPVIKSQIQDLLEHPETYFDEETELNESIAHLERLQEKEQNLRYPPSPLNKSPLRYVDSDEIHFRDAEHRVHEAIIPPDIQEQLMKEGENKIIDINAILKDWKKRGDEVSHEVDDEDADAYSPIADSSSTSITPPPLPDPVSIGLIQPFAPSTSEFIQHPATHITLPPVHTLPPPLKLLNVERRKLEIEYNKKQDLRVENEFFVYDSPQKRKMKREQASQSADKQKQNYIPMKIEFRFSDDETPITDPSAAFDDEQVERAAVRFVEPTQVKQKTPPKQRQEKYESASMRHVKAQMKAERDAASMNKYQKPSHVYGAWYLPTKMWHVEKKYENNDQSRAKEEEEEENARRIEQEPPDIKEKTAKLAHVIPELYISTQYKSHLLHSSSSPQLHASHSHTSISHSPSATPVQHRRSITASTPHTASSSSPPPHSPISPSRKSTSPVRIPDYLQTIEIDTSTQHNHLSHSQSHSSLYQTPQRINSPSKALSPLKSSSRSYSVSVTSPKSSLTILPPIQSQQQQQPPAPLSPSLTVTSHVTSSSSSSHQHHVSFHARDQDAHILLKPFRHRISTKHQHPSLKDSSHTSSNTSMVTSSANSVMASLNNSRVNTARRRVLSSQQHAVYHDVLSSNGSSTGINFTPMLQLPNHMGQTEKDKSHHANMLSFIMQQQEEQQQEQSSESSHVNSSSTSGVDGTRASSLKSSASSSHPITMIDTDYHSLEVGHSQAVDQDEEEVEQITEEEALQYLRDEQQERDRMAQLAAADDEIDTSSVQESI